MKKNLNLLFLLFLLLNPWLGKAQTILSKIDRLEKAVFLIKSYNNRNKEIQTSSGFFISPNGIAIIESSILTDADSISLILNNGKHYGVQKVLSSHKMANLSIVKIDTNKKNEYFIPTQNNKTDMSENIIISQPESEDKQGSSSVYMGYLNTVYEAPYLGRIVKINSSFNSITEGSPVINNLGELIGIAGYDKETHNRYILSSRILADSLWINYNYNDNFNTWININRDEYKYLLYPYFKDGIVNLMNNNYVQSAKDFTAYLNNDSTNLEARIFRGEARRLYSNMFGMREDFSYVNKYNDKHFLLCFYKANYLLSQDKKDEAFEKYIQSINSNGKFPLSLIQFGLLLLDLHQDAESALKCFNEAIVNDPSYANGFYERSRLLLQYLNQTALALEDINIAVNLDPNLPGVFSIRGTLKIANQDYLNAIDDLNKALKLNPNDTHALFNRGLAYFNLGMQEESCEDWQKAGELGHYKALKYISTYCSKITSKKLNK